MDSLLSGGRLGVFARGPDGALGRSWQREPGGAWSDWADLGVNLISSPTVVQNADGRVEVFGLGPDGRLGNMWQEHDVARWWSAWSELGPALRGDPVVASNDEDRLELFAIGPDGHLGHMWQLRQHAGGWSSWESLGVTIRSQPTVCQNEDGHLELFAIGPDGVLGHTWQQPRELGGWAQWHDMEPEISGDPVVLRTADGRLELFAADPQGHLGHLWQHEPNGAAGWSPWERLGPLISTAPAVCANADGRLEVFALDDEGRLGHTWQERLEVAGGWAPWSRLEATLTGPPAVFADARRRLTVVAAGPDGRPGRIAQRSPDGVDGWTPWVSLGPDAVQGRVAVCQCGPGGVVDRQLVTDVQRRREAGWTMLLPTTLTADVCVIGAGPAGVTVADGLVRAGASVVLVESGGWHEDPITEELNRGTAVGPLLHGHRRYLTDGRARQVQGAAGKWGPGWIMPMEPIDFESRPWVPLSGWPVTPAELAPYVSQATRTFGFDPYPIGAEGAALRRVSYQFPHEPQLFRAIFLRLLTHPRFRAEFGATALELETDRDRITAVRCGRLGGGGLRIAADTVVLATGGIENARLLLLNHDRLPEPNDMIGRCFMEHPHVLVGGAWLPDAEPLRSYFYGGSRLDVLTLSDARQRSARLLNASVQLRRLTWDPSPHVPVQCDLFLRAEQAPNPDSRVLLGERDDRFRRPQPRLEWQVLDQDWDSIVRTAEQVAAELRDGFDGQVWVSVDGATPWPGLPGGPQDSHDGSWGYHLMGTTRMADDPAHGVVDRDGRVHGTDNLYVAGSSVFPTGGCANPTFTIVALAHRLADHLASAG